MTEKDRALLIATEIVSLIVRCRIYMWYVNKDVHAWIRQLLGDFEASGSKVKEETEA